MRLLLPLALALALGFAPSAAATSVGSGHIVAGSPTTMATALEGVTSFYLAAPLPGTLVSSETIDHGGLGYDIDFYFWSAAGDYLGGCFTAGSEELDCVVPTGAAQIEVSAYFGVELDVTVHTA